MDLAYYFIHRGLDLLKPGGVLSFILSAYWTTARGAEKLIGRLRGMPHEEISSSIGRRSLPEFPAGT